MNHCSEKTSLGDSEAFLSLALRVTKAGTWRWDKVTNQVFWSKENCQLLGYDPQTTAASYENWLKAVHPGDRERVASQLAQAFSAATELNLEYRVLLPDGSVRWLAAFGERIDGEDGEPAGMIGIQLDITERKQAEKAQQTRLQVAMEAASMGIWESDLRTHTEWWSPQVEALFGFAPNTFDGDRNTFLARVHPDDRATVNADWEAAMRTGILRDNDYRMILPDQSIRWLSTLGKVFYDEAGHPIQVIGVDVDITERKQAEIALARSEALFRSLIDNLPFEVWAKDREKRVIVQNPLARLRWGDNLYQIADRSKLSPELRAAWQEQDQRVWNGEVVQVEESDWVHGEWRTYTKIMAPIWHNGEIEAVLGVNIDITDRKRTEEELRQSELRFRNMAANVPGAIFRYVMHPDGSDQVIYMSPGCFDLWEVEADVVVEDARILWELIDDEDRPAMYESVLASARTLQPWSWQWRITTPSGKRKWLEASGRPQRLPNGDVVWDSLIVDISDRKWAAMALQESEARFRQLAENIREVFWMADIELSQILYVSPAYELIWGRTCASLYDNPESLLEAMHPEDRDRVLTVIQQRRYQGWNQEYRIVQPDGSVRWIWERAFPVTDANGQIQRVVGICQDISDRKQAELEIRQLNEALEQQNRNLEALVEERTALLLTFINALPDYIYVIEREEMRILFCNDRLARVTLLGDRYAVQGKTIFECFPPETAADFAEQNRQVFESGETMHIQEDCELASQHLHVDTYKIPLRRPDGTVYALISTSRDITELVLARQALIQRTAQLEVSNKELESFSYSVSHDLRAPLRHIHGFVNALQQRLQGHHALSDPKVVHYLQVIETSSQKMGLLIDGLLTLSRVGRKPMHYAPVQLRSLVEEAIALVQSSAETVLATEFVIGELPTVQGDETLLQQVFSNLISNAVKFSQHHPTPRVEIGSSPEGTIWIKDNGVGFQMEYADKLFGAFQRLHNQLEFEGTGIGLAIVQRIIHRHGGIIWAESQPNQGATFFFKLTSDLNFSHEKDAMLF